MYHAFYVLYIRYANPDARTQLRQVYVEAFGIIEVSLKVLVIQATSLPHSHTADKSTLCET
jgi:hypothetical protein